VRIACFYDIHGNLPALEATLQEIRRMKVDVVVFGGDILPGPFPQETVALVQDLDIPVRCIRGNGEREAFALSNGDVDVEVPQDFHAGMKWCVAQLSSEQRHFVESWPICVSLEAAPGMEILFCHATPFSDSELFTAESDESRVHQIFAGCEVPTVVCGHTHMQFDRTVGQWRIINSGSVGMAFGSHEAQWLLIDSGDIRLQSTPYDRRDAAAQILQSSYPDAEFFVDRFVNAVPNQAGMVQLFEQSIQVAQQQSAND